MAKGIRYEDRNPKTFREYTSGYSGSGEPTGYEALIEWELKKLRELGVRFFFGDAVFFGVCAGRGGLGIEGEAVDEEGTECIKMVLGEPNESGSVAYEDLSELEFTKYVKFIIEELKT